MANRGAVWLATAACHLAVFAGSTSSGQTVMYEWVLRREAMALDGVTKEGVITVNGQTPGPPIRVRPGDLLVVRVANENLEDGTSVHWHGQHLRGGQLYEDGVPFVTQCAIMPGESYTYSFNVNDSPGFYLYHGHHHAQRGDGLSGPFIIEDPAESLRTASWDAEYSFMIQDWYHERADIIVAGLDHVPFKWADDPQSILINGKGKFNESVGENEHVGVVPGQTVLMRLVNAGVLSYLNVEIENHNLTVIEADGQPIEPITVPNLDINIGERYVVLVTMDQPPAVYDMRASVKYRNERVGIAQIAYEGATGEAAHPELESDDLLGEQTEYEGDVQAAPLHVGSQSILDPRLFVGASDMPADMAHYDEELIIDGRQAVGSDNRTRWPLNNHTPNKGWLAARRNVLPAGPTPNTWRYPYGTVLDIVLQNFPAGNRVVEQHPWHLHGHSFYVLGYGPGRFNRTEHEGLLNLKNPPLRDMVTTFPDGNNSWVAPRYQHWRSEPSGWAVVRVRLDNPGHWMVHCHIAWHMAMEMFGFIITDPAQAPGSTTPRLLADFPQCMHNQTARKAVTNGTDGVARELDDSSAAGPPCWRAAVSASIAGLILLPMAFLMA